MSVFPAHLPGQILAPDEGIQVFRAPTPSARLDWVAALAIVATAHDLGIWKPLRETSPPPRSTERAEGGGNHAGGAERKCGNGSDSGIVQGEDGGAIYVVRRSLGLGGKRRMNGREVGGVQEGGGGPREYMLQQREEEEEEEEWGRTEAVGGEGRTDGPAARIVMQGFLKKRMAGRLWAAWEGWEYRWVVLRVRCIVVP